MTMRTQEMENSYQMAKKMGWLRPLNQEKKVATAPDFNLWVVIENRYPHDRHHTINHLVVLKRKTSVDWISAAEWEEFWKKIMPWANKNGYDYIKFNLSSTRSVEDYPHLHLMTLKQEYK